MTHFRAYRNDDSPALAALWNRGLPERGAARPLSPHEFDACITSGPLFDRAGLVVAERDRTLVGFAHAGFGPENPTEPPLRLSYMMGTLAMLIIDPSLDDIDVEKGLVERAEGYLRAEGAQVIYAGGHYPLNPFYWGVYGGSEWAGILSGHHSFHRAVTGRGFEAVGTTVLLEADLSQPEQRDPRGVLIRRHSRLEVVEDATPRSWWDALAIGDRSPTLYRLMTKTDNAELARATTWDMTPFGRLDGKSRVGLVDMEVNPALRRKGYGRHLVNEILRSHREQATAVVCLQTHSTNTAAIALYQSVGFHAVDMSTLYRLPGVR